MKSKNEEWTSTMMAPIAAGNARVKWMKSAFHQDPKVKSWRITMEFDASGDLLKYWEASLDRDGNEVMGGGIDRSSPSRAIKSKGMRLSDLQIDVLLLGVDHKLDRSSMGWSYDDRVNWSDPVRMYRPATIKALWARGLLVGNFNDLGDILGDKNLDGAVHEHSPETLKFQVWTSDLGKEVLKEVGLLPYDAQMLH